MTTTTRAGSEATPDCDELRSELKDAKAYRVSNGFDNVEEPAEVQRVDDTARVARQAGCDISDLVGSDVGA